MDHKPSFSFMQLIFPGIALSLGIVLLFQSQPFWWFGVGLVAASLNLFATLLPSPRALATNPAKFDDWKNFFAEWFCIGVLVFVVIAMMPEIMTGLRPVNHDHTVHLAKIWRLQHSFLAEGKLWGWSHQWFAGYPAQYLYPIGADLWVLVIQWLSFGLLSLGQAYAIGFALHWLVLGYALFVCARQALPRSVGLLAAILLITDIGAYRMGGWVFTSVWGVWPMNLSLAFGLLAVSRLQRILFGTRWRDVALFGLWVGLALLTHPVQLIHLGVLIPVALLARWLVGGSSHLLLASARLLLASGIGLAIGGLWLFPFIASKAFSQAYGVLWRDAFRLGIGIYDLDLLPGTWPVAIAVGVLGLLGMLFSRRFYPLLFALLAFVLLLTCSSTFVESFHLLELTKAFQNIQFQRFAVLLKPYLLIAGAYVMVLAFQHLASMFREKRPDTTDTTTTEASQEYARAPWSMFVRLLLVGFLLAPFAFPFVNHYSKRHVKHMYKGNGKEKLETINDDEFHSSKQAFVAWAKKEFPKVKGFFRLALMVGDHDHRFFDIGTQLKVPLYKAGFTPATSYRYKMEIHAPKMMRAVNVLYVLSKWSLSPHHYELVRKFDRLYVYRMKQWNPQPFEITEGSGKVHLQTFQPEDIVLKADPGSKGTLRLNVSYFHRWTVTHNGQPLTIRLNQLNGDPKTGFMTVVLKPGTYHFQFRRGFSEIASFVLFLLGLGLCLTLCLVDWRSPGTGWLRHKLEQGTQQLNSFEALHGPKLQQATVLVVMAVIGFGLALAIWDPAQLYRHPYLREKPHQLRYSFTDSLKQAQARVGRDKQCSYQQERFHCGPAEWQHIHVKQVRLDAKNWQRCIWMHPQSDGVVTLNYKGVTVGDLLAGYIAIAKSGHMDNPTPVEFLITVNGKKVYQGKTQRDGIRYHFHAMLPPALRRKTVNVSFQVQARQTGRRHFCFLVQGIQLQDP